MTTDKIVHFVYFETILGSDQFIPKWEHYLRSSNSDADVTVQESKKNNLFTYIAEHRCGTDEFQFLFTKAAKLTRAKETEIKTVQLGGYSIIQEEKSGSTDINESKIFILLNYTDISFYKQLQFPGKLNIYEAYFENCVYTYILEYFIKNKDIAELKEKLHQYNTTGINIYKECLSKAV